MIEIAGEQGRSPEGAARRPLAEVPGMPGPARTTRRRRVIIAGVAAAIAAAVAAQATRGGGVPVQLAPVARGELRETVSGTGNARVRQRHLVTAPVSGFLERIQLVPGDPVRAGQVVAVVGPSTPTPLDVRSRAEQEGRLATARAAERVALAALEGARAAERNASAELERTRVLAEDGAVAARDLDAAALEQRTRRAEREMAEASARRAAGEVAVARAALGAEGGARAAGVPVPAPAGGQVLRVLQESEGSVAAGTPLFEVGDPADLEVALELLTSDAVRVKPGQPVELRQWGGTAPLRGVVGRVDPSGFTKISALGVEEQRVIAVVLPSSPADWRGLADRYHVEAEVVVAAHTGVLQVPLGSLVRREDGWAVFVVKDGRSRLRPVRLGAMGALAAEVLDGLADGDHVVLYPGDRVADGERVRGG